MKGPKGSFYWTVKFISIILKLSLANVDETGDPSKNTRKQF